MDPNRLRQYRLAKFAPTVQDADGTDQAEVVVIDTVAVPPVDLPALPAPPPPPPPPSSATCSPPASSAPSAPSPSAVSLALQTAVVPATSNVNLLCVTADGEFHTSFLLNHHLE